MAARRKSAGRAARVAADSSRRASKAAGSMPRRWRSPSMIRPSPSWPTWCAAPAARRSAPIANPSAGGRCCWRACRFAAVQPTPFQRDLSPTHAKRLAAAIEETAAFLDPLIVVRGEDGRLWTPNGRHRLAAAKVLGLKQITALISGDESLAYRILALNTEKAHNLKDRSLEVIRMARNLAKRRGREREEQFRAEFEAAELLTLGIVYDKAPRFAGGAYSAFLKKVDRFSDRTLAASLRQREDYAARLLEIDAPREDRHRRRCRRAASSRRTCATTWWRASTRCASTRSRRATARRRCRSRRH